MVSNKIISSNASSSYLKQAEIISIAVMRVDTHYGSAGYVTSLEEMFNPARHRDDFVPSGFKRPQFWIRPERRIKENFDRFFKVTVKSFLKYLKEHED